jgi:hypothetical protein
MNRAFRASPFTQAFLRIRTVSCIANTLAGVPTSIEYELITADVQETTARPSFNQTTTAPKARWNRALGF